MGKKLYVGNMSYQTSDESLRALFGEYGTVESVNLITDRDTGRRRGFGFVEMGTDDEARAAIAGMNGKSVDDRELNVAEARPQRDRSSGGGGGGRRGVGGRPRW
jgi:RNA recognition motif-containing protein